MVGCLLGDGYYKLPVGVAKLLEVPKEQHDPGAKFVIHDMHSTTDTWAGSFHLSMDGKKRMVQDITRSMICFAGVGFTAAKKLRAETKKRQGSQGGPPKLEGHHVAI